MAGEHNDAISRLDDLIATVHMNSICHVVQACVSSIYHTANVTTYVSSRRICIYPLETCTWRAATTRVQSNHLSVHEPKCVTTEVDLFLWSR